MRKFTKAARVEARLPVTSNRCRGSYSSIALDGRVIAGYILFQNLLGNSHFGRPFARSRPGPIRVIAHIHRLLGNLRATSAQPASRDRRGSSPGPEAGFDSDLY